MRLFLECIGYTFEFENDSECAKVDKIKQLIDKRNHLASSTACESGLNDYDLASAADRRCGGPAVTISRVAANHEQQRLR